MVKRFVLLFVFLLGMLLIPAVSKAQPPGCGMMYRGMPYGRFCPGPRSRPYGAPKPVRTAGEARQLIESYYSGYSQHLHCGKIEEKNWYFEADVLDRNGLLADRVIVDKRTGRIRSIY
jgi:hypothetical protein